MHTKYRERVLLKKLIASVLVSALVVTGAYIPAQEAEAAEVSTPTASEMLDKAQEVIKETKVLRSVSNSEAKMLNTDFMNNISDGNKPSITDLIASGFPKYDEYVTSTIAEENGIDNITKTQVSMKINDESSETIYYTDSKKIYSQQGSDWYFTPLEEYDYISDEMSDYRSKITDVVDDIKALAKIAGQESIKVEDTLNPDKPVNCYKIIVEDLNPMDIAKEIAGDAIGSAYASELDKIIAKSSMIYYIGVDDNRLYKTIQDVTMSASIRDAAEYFGITIDSDRMVEGMNMHVESYLDYTAPAVELPPEVKAARITSGFITSDKTFTYEVKYSGKTPVLCVNSLDKNKKSVKVPASVKILDKSYKVTSVEAYAFDKGTKTTKLTLPKSVTKVGKSAFKKCKKLKTLVVKNAKLRKKLKTKKGRKSAGIGAKVKIKK